MYMSGDYDVIFFFEFFSNRFQTLPLWSPGIEVYCYDFLLRIPTCHSGFIQDFLNPYVWIDVDSIMYMSGEACFIV